MKKPNVNLVIYIVSLLILVYLFIIIGFYFDKFGEFGRTNNHEVWGQFGDYIGGLLNPFLAFINMIILIYITIYIDKLNAIRNESFSVSEEKREKEHLKLQIQTQEKIIRMQFRSEGYKEIVKTLNNLSDQIYQKFPENYKNLINTLNLYGHLFNLSSKEIVEFIDPLQFVYQKIDNPDYLDTDYLPDLRNLEKHCKYHMADLHFFLQSTIIEDPGTFNVFLELKNIDIN